MTMSCLLISRLFITRKLLNSILLVALSFFGFMTLSRSFLLCYLLMWFMYLIVIRKSIRFKNILYLFLFVVLLVFIFSENIQYIFDSFALRFQEEDISNGRIDLFLFYSEFIMASPLVFLFGIGLQDIPVKVENMYGIYENVPHNGIQEVVLCWGLVGLTLFVLLLIFLFKAINKKERKFILYLPLIILLLSTMFGQIIRSGNALLELLICYLCLHCSYIKKELKNE